MDRSIFNKAVDALNEYMADHNAHLFDPPTKEFSSMDGEYVYLGNATNSFGKYCIATGEYLPDTEE